MGPGPWIVEWQPVSVAREVKRYAPLARQVLHREFARLDGATDKRFLDFANEYGLLGGSQGLLAAGAGPRPLLVGESLACWRLECQRLRLLLDLWDDARGAANRGDPVDAGLTGRIVWEGAPYRSVALRWPERGVEAPIASEAPPYSSGPGRNQGILRTWADGNLAAPARFYVCELVSAALRGQASRAVLPMAGRELAIVPHTGLAGLYVLFALELSGRVRELRPCENCGAYFSPVRSDQRFCGASCRKKHKYLKDWGGD